MSRGSTRPSKQTTVNAARLTSPNIPCQRVFQGTNTAESITSRNSVMETGSSSSTRIPTAVLQMTTAPQYAKTHQRQPRADRVRYIAQAAATVRMRSDERSRSGTDLPADSYDAISKNEADAARKYNPTALSSSLLSVAKSTSASGEKASLFINHDIWNIGPILDEASSPTTATTALPVRFPCPWHLGARRMPYEKGFAYTTFT